MNLEVLKGATGALLEGARFNGDYTRLCMPTSVGVACYRGMRDEHGEWTGSLAGIAPDDEEAQRFLDGAFAKLRSAS